MGTLVLWTLCLVGTFNSWMVSGWAREREGVAMPGTPRWYTRWYTGPRWHTRGFQYPLWDDYWNRLSYMVSRAEAH